MKEFLMNYQWTLSTWEQYNVRLFLNVTIFQRWQMQHAEKVSSSASEPIKRTWQKTPAVTEKWELIKKGMVLQLPMSLSYPKILHMILMKQKATRTYSKSFSFIIQSECSPWQVEVRKFLNESQQIRLINASSIQGNW